MSPSGGNSWNYLFCRCCLCIIPVRTKLCLFVLKGVRDTLWGNHVGRLLCDRWKLVICNPWCEIKEMHAVYWAGQALYTVLIMQLFNWWVLCASLESAIIELRTIIWIFYPYASTVQQTDIYFHSTHVRRYQTAHQRPSALFYMCKTVYSSHLL